MKRKITVTVHRSATVQIAQYTPETVSATVTAEYEVESAWEAAAAIRETNEMVESFVGDEQAKLFDKAIK